MPGKPRVLLPSAPPALCGIHPSATTEWSGEGGVDSLWVWDDTAVGNFPPSSSPPPISSTHSCQKQLDCGLAPHAPCTAAGITRDCTQGAPGCVCVRGTPLAMVPWAVCHMSHP